MEWTDVTERLAGIGVAHLATTAADGHPHVAKVGVAVDGEHLWFFTLEDTAKATNLRARPFVALMWEGNQAETYVWGEAEMVDDLATKERVFASGLLPYDPVGFFGSADNPALVLARISPTRAAVVGAVDGRPARLRWAAGS